MRFPLGCSAARQLGNARAVDESAQDEHRLPEAAQRTPPLASPGRDAVAVRQLAQMLGGGVLLTVFVYACYIFVGRALERRVFTASRPLGRGLRTGAFFPVIALCVVPPQLVALAFGMADPTQGIVYYLYVTMAGLLVPVFFRNRWRHLPLNKIITLYCCSLGLAAFTAVG